MIWGRRKTAEDWTHYPFGTPEVLLVSFAEDEYREMHVVDYGGNRLRLTVLEPEPVEFVEEPATARLLSRPSRRPKK